MSEWESNDDEDQKDDDSVEEGEIEPTRENVIPQSKSEVGESPEVDILVPNLRSSLGNDEGLDNNYVSHMHEMHGDRDATTPVPRFNKVQKGPTSVTGMTHSGGPDLINLESNQQQPNTPGINLGPTPTNALGKRPRAARTPQSSGSMEGPPNRSFFQNVESGKVSIDLNSPSNNGRSTGITEENVQTNQQSSRRQSGQPMVSNLNPDPGTHTSTYPAPASAVNDQLNLDQETEFTAMETD
ncbi:hypothetical protein Hanom_Chr15g01393661 [Helianthus anomalus]